MSGQSQSRSRTTDKRYFGVYEAIVTAVTGDKANEGRVKVKFPWFDDDLSTEWCRVRQSYAGNGYGSFFVPEEKTKCLSRSFRETCDFPSSLGGCTTGKTNRRLLAPKNKNQKMIRTKGKHEILLDDSKDKQRVRIKTNKGHTVDLSDVDKKITINTAGGPKVEIDDAAKKITIDTNGKSITIDGNSGNITSPEQQSC